MSRLTLQITDLGSGIMVQGNDNHFFPDNATLTFPYNSIIVVTDESDMATFRSASNNDVLFSGLIGAIEIDGESVTKENINIKFDAIANQSSGGGGDITGLFASVSYDSQTKHINFYDTDRTLVDYVDATNFIKDGMVSNVEISNGNLVITFNTDAGKEPITIPLTDIFNPNNYYDKTQSDSLFASQTVVNQEVAARIQGDSDLNTALATKADKSDTYSKQQCDNTFVSQADFDIKEEVISTALNDLESTKLDASDAFSGDYNDLTNKPTIPDTSDFVSKAEYNPKEVAIAEALTNLNENKADKTELNGKQDTLTAGTGISIQNNVISAAGGGGDYQFYSESVDSETGEQRAQIENAYDDGEGVTKTSMIQTYLDEGSEPYVDINAYQQVTTSEKENQKSADVYVSTEYGVKVVYENNDNIEETSIENHIYVDGNGVEIHTSESANSETVETSMMVTKDGVTINSNKVLTEADVETRITSGSTDDTIPSSRAVYNAIDEVDDAKVNNLGGVTNILKITSADYEALATKDNNTLYIITTN